MAELGVHQSALLTDLALCINRYRLFSPGWYVCVLAKVQLSPEESEVPGLVPMVNYGRKMAGILQDIAGSLPATKGLTAAPWTLLASLSFRNSIRKRNLEATDLLTALATAVRMGLSTKSGYKHVPKADTRL